MSAYLHRFVREALAIDYACPVFDATERVWRDTARDLFFYAAHVKDSAFLEEREWRLVSPPITTQDELVKFRVGRYSLVPYIEFELVDQAQPGMPLHEIIVGPTPIPLAALHAIMGMQLSVRHSDHTRAVPCNIPYREV